MAINNNHIDSLWLNANLATFAADNSCGVITHAAMAIDQGKIVWLGKERDLPAKLKHIAKNIHQANQAWLTPGFIDCHSHLVYAGNRANEFEQRLHGKTYADIAKSGGGLLNTVYATRAISEHDLLRESAKRLTNLISEGVTTIEIKSGYGLDLATEIKMLRVAKLLEQQFPISVITTFLGAHALAPEFSNANAYIDYICDVVLPTIKNENLATFVDGFCETIAFSSQQLERVFARAQQLGFAIKIHAEQLSNQGGAKLAAKYHAVSADHLEYIDEEDVKALAAAGTTAVLLPGSWYFLQEKQRPPVELLRRYKIPIAIATNCNPGTSPVTSLLLMLNMACVLFHLTPEEALNAVTKNAARALGIGNIVGTLEIGKHADCVLWDIEHLRDLVYQIGTNPCRSVIKNGVLHEKKFSF